MTQAGIGGISGSGSTDSRTRKPSLSRVYGQYY